LYDGNRIGDDDTPASLGMEDNDSIDVMVERECGSSLSPPFLRFLMAFRVCGLLLRGRRLLEMPMNQNIDKHSSVLVLNLNMSLFPVVRHENIDGGNWWLAPLRPTSPSHWPCYSLVFLNPLSRLTHSGNESIQRSQPFCGMMSLQEVEWFYDLLLKLYFKAVFRCITKQLLPCSLP